MMTRLELRFSWRKIDSFADAKLGEFSHAVSGKKKTDTRLGVRFFFGADDEARTRYLHLGKVALYQMSYIRISLQRWVL